jgi:predicted DNA-binding WGR domain protein
MRRFEFKDAKSNKFWEVEVKGKNLQVTFGKIGTEGQSKPKAFATPEKAKAEMEKLIKEKTGKGYVEVGGNENSGKKTKPNILYPEIKRLKELGATTIRVWFQGMGDDGIFSSTIYKGNKVLEEPHTLDEFGGEIQILYETNQLEIPDGGQDGDAAIMTIDLKTGECIFFKEYNARKEELLDNLLWEGVDELDANLEAEAGEEIEEEIADEISILNLRKIVLINPIKGKPKLTTKEKIKVEELLKWWLSCEKNTNCICGSDLYSDLSNLGSSKINFYISTSKRTMIFSSGKKKLEFKIQALEKQKIKLEI